MLVPKTHPVIAFRGAMDSLQAQLLLAQQAAPEGLRREIGQVLTLARNILRWEVMEEPAKLDKLCGLTAEELRQRSHHPGKFYGIPHFMPEHTDGTTILQLNVCRCAARAAELAAAHAFTSADGNCTRPDLLQVLNRMSSMLYLLMIQEKSRR